MKNIVTSTKKRFLGLFLLLPLIVAGFSTPALSQYTGVGDFTLITSQGELEEGYYVVTNGPGEFAMNNAHTGSLLPNTPVNTDGGTISSPDETDVWFIQEDGGGWTIFSENSGQYLGYTGSGNTIQVSPTVDGDEQRWSFVYQPDNDVFEVRNLATPERALRYNPSSPRFVTYATSFGQNLNLYKLGEATDPGDGIGPFSLLSPPNNARLPVFEGNSSEVVIEWEDAEDAETYTWVANLQGESLDDPLLSLESDNDGTATTLTLTSGALYDVLADLGIETGSSVTLSWSVLAENEDDSRLANQTWNITIARPLAADDIAAVRNGESDVIYFLPNEVTFYGGDNFRNRKFLYDGSLGIMIDDQPGVISTVYEPGDGITNLVGSLVVFSGQAQFVPFSDPGAPSSSGNDISAEELSLEELMDDFPLYQSRLVKVNNVAFASPGGNFSNGVNYDINDAADAEIEGTFRTDFFNMDYIGTPIPDEDLNITGFAITRQNTIDFVVARSLADFEIITDQDQVATPVFDPAPGSFVGEVTVSISTSTPDAEIYFTLDGSEPTQESELYTEAITLTETTTLSAIAFADGFDASNVRTGEYVIEDEVLITTIAELREQVGAGTVTFSGEALLSFQQTFRNQKFIQDETGGILIDDQSGTITTTYAVGDAITNLTGSVNVFGNMVQFVPAADPGAPVSSGNEIVPVELSFEEYLDDFMIYQSRVVTVTGVQFTNPGGNFANGQVYPIASLDDVSLTGEFRATFFGVDYIGTPIPDAPQNVTGIPNSRSEGDFLTARNLADFETFASDDQVVAPVIAPGSGLFTEPVEVSMTVADEQASIFYTIDGEEPTEGSIAYTGPFTVSETTQVRARAFRAGFEPSAIVSATYSFPIVADNILDARDLPIGTAVQVTGVLTTPDFGFNNAEFYMQDDEGGIKVRWPGFGGGNTDTPFEVGQEIVLVGTLALRFEELLIEPVSFEVLSTGNDLPEATPITDYESQWTIDTDLQATRTTIMEVSLVDPSQWPTEPIPGGSGVTLQAVDADGNIYDIRIDRDESEFEASPVPPAVFNLSGVLGRFNDNAQIFPFFLFELEEVMEAPRAQIIHNAADPALAVVDVYVNGSLLFGDVPFRGATPFFDAPGDTEFTVSLTGAGEPLENAVFEADVVLDSGSTYYIIAQGVVDTGAFEPNPNGIDTGFFLDIIEGAQEAPESGNNVEFAIYHGVTDAPTVDVLARDLDVIADGLSYTDITDGYISISADSYILDINLAGTGNTVASFTADLSMLGGNTALVLASGFLNPGQGEPFGLLVVLADGTSLMLDMDTSLGNDGEVPVEFALKQNYPNPFNPTTQITYALPEAINVQVEVYNIAGQRVAVLVNGQQSAGVHTVTFDASRLSSGVYLYRIQAGSFSDVRKMMLVK
ncbi:MAG: chitobiase/beta-hexosaminidase C-terminal domain-containing protein [Balneolales bacterium]|nr:chitobiase/beta-hexosaminidase C-terminal domain-containing protein [Balneolales bacterium]